MNVPEATLADRLKKLEAQVEGLRRDRAVLAVVIGLALVVLFVRHPGWLF